MMKTLFDRHRPVYNILCAILIAALLVLQFMPFWTYGEESASVQGYIWSPINEALESYIKEQTDPDFRIENILAMPLVVIILGAVSVILCLKKSDNHWVCILPAIVGLTGILGYTTSAVFRLGANWQLHVVVSAVILIVSIVSLVSGIRGKTRDLESETILR